MFTQKEKEKLFSLAQSIAANNTEFGNITAGSVRIENDLGQEHTIVEDSVFGSIIEALKVNSSSIKEVVNNYQPLTGNDVKYEADSASKVFVNSPGVVSNHAKDLVRMEAFDGIASRSSQAFALITNISFTQSTNFEKVLFPKITTTADKTTLEVQKNVPVIYNNINRDIINLSTSFRTNLESIPLRLWTKELIKSNSTRILHILGKSGDTETADSRKPHLVESLKRDTNFKNQTVQVAPIAVLNSTTSQPNEVDIINLSSISYALNEMRNDRDSLNNTVALKRVFVKFTVSGKSLTYCFDVSNKVGNIFTVNNERADKTLMLSSSLLVEGLSLKTLKDYEPKTDLNDKENTEFATAVDTIAEFNLEIVPNLGIDLASGLLSVKSFVALIRNATVAGSVKAEVLGFELDATLANVNLREIGTLMGNIEFNFNYQIDFKDPVSVQGPISDLGKGGDNADFNKAIELGTMINAQSAVWAVKTFLDYFNAIKNEKAKSSSLISPSERTLSYAYVQKAVSDVIQDVSTTNSLTSTQLMQDIGNNIMNRVKVEADKLYNDSKYNNAFEFVMGRKGDVRPTIAIVTSTNVAKYLGIEENDDVLTKPQKLTTSLDYIVVTLPSNSTDINPEFYEHIFMTFVDPTNINSGVIESINPISFGFNIYKPFTTIEFQKSATDVVKYMSAFPTYRHVAHLPIMGRIKLTGLPEMTSKKVAIEVTNTAFSSGQITVK